MNDEWLQTPIPKDAGITEGWQSIPIRLVTDPLVAIGPLSDYPELFTNSIYAGERDDSPYRGLYALPHASVVICVRKSVAQKLVKAQAKLPANKILIVYDGYRSIEVQRSLYDHYRKELEQIFPDHKDDWLDEETEKYITNPDAQSEHPAPHTTGGAVDLAIIDIDPTVYQQRSHILKLGQSPDRDVQMTNLIANAAQHIDFGTPFDHGDPEAALAYYEKIGPETARNNRRLLYHLMSSVGMASFSTEWWHFNAPETQMGARALGKNSASFSEVTLNDSIRELIDFRSKLPFESHITLPKVPVIEPSSNHRVI